MQERQAVLICRTSFLFMEISNIRSLLDKINHFDQVTHGSGPIEEVESHLLNYLKQNQNDLEMWYNLVLLNLIFLHDETSALKYLAEMRAKFSDPKITILICFIQNEFLGGIEERDFKILETENAIDKKIEACRAFYLAMYYKNCGKGVDYSSRLIESTVLYKNFVHAYIELGYFFQEEKHDKKTAQSYFFRALDSIEKILAESEIKTYNYFDLDNYFDEMIFGVWCTTPKYEYIKSLVVESA